MQSFSAHASDDDEQVRRLSAPENEVPVALPIGAVLARTDRVAVTLTDVQVFTTGLSFGLGVRCLPEVLDLIGDRTIGSVLFGRVGPRDQLLVGVEFADGRRAGNVPGRNPFAPSVGPD